MPLRQLSKIRVELFSKEGRRERKKEGGRDRRKGGKEGKKEGKEGVELYIIRIQ